MISNRKHGSFQRLAFAVAFMLPVHIGRCDDWPGHLGPHRTGASDSVLLDGSKFPNELTAAWSIPAGEGYAGAAIRDGKAYLFDRDSDDFDRLRCVGLENGAVEWEETYPSTFRGGIDSDRGPRCVPTVLEETILLYAADGSLTLVDRKDGKLIWTKPLRRQFGADDGYFGAGSTPLVIGNRAIVNVGANRAGIVAVDLADGQILWTQTNYDASYAAPIAMSVKSDNQSPAEKSFIVIVPTRLKTVALDPNDGMLLWEVAFGQRGPTVNAATPIHWDNQVFLTASYGIGCKWLDVSSRPSKVEVVAEEEVLSSQYATPIFIDGLIYGSDGREDGGPTPFKCLDTTTHQLVWQSDDSLPISHIISIQDKQILLVGLDGSIRLLSPSRQGFQLLGQSSTEISLCRPLPALSQKRLILRTAGPGTWSCYELPTAD